MSWEQFMSGVAIDLLNELKRQAPWDTGHLKISISIEQINDDTIVFSMPEYGEYVEFGTNPHIIRPKNKKVLHWKNGTKDVFAKEVHHPGTRPNPFIRRTLHQKLKPIINSNAKLYL